MSSSGNMSVENEKISIKKMIIKIKMFVNYSSDPSEKQYDKKINIKKKIKIFKLNINNYRIWTTMMKINFDDKILWKIINDDVKKFFANKSINKQL